MSFAHRLALALPVLCEIDCFSLEHVEQCLRRLQDLHVRRLRLLDRFIVLVPRLHLACQRLVDLALPVREDGEILLDLRLLLLLLEDLLVHLLALLPHVLDTLNQLVVVVLKRRTFLRFCHINNN